MGHPTRARTFPRSPWTVAATMTVALAAACFLVGARAATAPLPAGLVTQDQTALRGSPSEGAPQLTLLYRGDALEVRGRRGDYLQVWDHWRERGGWVRQGQVYAVRAAATDAVVADELLALLRYVQDQPGAEALGLSLAAAAIQALPAARLTGLEGADLLDAIGQQAERLADRASGPAPLRLADQAALSAHLDGALRHGVSFTSLEQSGKTVLCYEGDAWRRLMALKAARPEQQARAALALTRPDCQDPAANPRALEQADASRAAVLGSVSESQLPPHWKNRLNIRRAGVHASLAFAHARRGDAPSAASHAERAVQALARVEKGELADVDTARYDEAAVRVGAVRWAAQPGSAPVAGVLDVQTRSTADGQNCVVLQAKGAPVLLAERCTWGVVWPASATINREGTAVALAVQPTDGWRELWIYRKGPSGWVLQVLPPAAQSPGLGYAEFAGWVPGGQQVLVAREACNPAAARCARRFEVLQLDTLIAERTAFEPGVLGAFGRWQDPAWRQSSVAVR